MKYEKNIPVPDEFDLDQSVGLFDAWMAGKDIEFDHAPAVSIELEMLGSTAFLVATKGWMECSPYRANMALLSAVITARGGANMTAGEKKLMAALYGLAHLMRKAEERHEYIAFQGGAS